MRKVIGIVGWKDVGKTFVVTEIIKLLVQKGYKVGSIKHAHHNFEVDKPGKDSYEHRLAGAQEVIISSRNRWALIHEQKNQTEPGLPELLDKLMPVDLVLIEGFKKADHVKLEVHRNELGKDLICHNDPKICMVASDVELTGLHVPVFDINDYDAVSDFIIEHLKIKVT